MIFLSQENKFTGKDSGLYTAHYSYMSRYVRNFCSEDFMRKEQLKTYKMK